MVGRVLSLLWAVIIVIVLPLQALLTRRLLARLRPSAAQAYASTLRGLWALGLITLAIDWIGARSGIHAAALPLPPLEFLAWTAGLFAVCIAITLLGFVYRRLRRRPPEATTLALLPRTRHELLLFTAVALTAGLVEEYVIRGFCLAALASATRSPAVAFTLVTLGFGLAHGYQGAISMVRATLLGAVLGVSVLLTGALAPAMVAHAGMDIASGLWTLPLLRRMGVLEQSP